MDRGRQLLPVPPRPPRSTDVELAARHVERLLPELEPDAVRALALVELAARTPVEASAALATNEGAVRDLLARARKELRRSSFPLSATGWCERAERLLSDRLDGPLDARGAGRVESHLRNCGRCVEHERRLASARVALVEGFLSEHGAREVAPPAVAADPEVALRAVAPPTERIEVEPAATPEPTPAHDAELAPAAEPEPDVQPEPPRPAEPELEAEPAVEQPLARDEAAEPPIALRPGGHGHQKGAEAGEESLLAALTTGGAWAALTAVSVVLAVLSVIVTVLGMVGVDRLF